MLCYELSFFPTKILFILINYQLLTTASAKDINTDYYITNSTLASRYHGAVSVEVANENSNKIRGFEPG